MDVLVISAHPDDETIGCGGTLLKHRARGDRLFWLIATRAFEPQWSAQTISRQAAEVEAVVQAYQVEHLFVLGQPSTRLDIVPQAELMASIRGVAEQVKPQYVYVVNRSDVHSDHRAVFEATLSVFKPFHVQLRPRRIMCYETLSSTDAAPALQERAFVPNTFSDITPFIERKLDVMRLYQGEVQPYPQPRAPESVRALARFRGATIGVEYAEAFALIREVF